MTAAATAAPSAFGTLRVSTLTPGLFARANATSVVLTMRSAHLIRQETCYLPQATPHFCSATAFPSIQRIFCCVGIAAYTLAQLSRHRADDLALSTPTRSLLHLTISPLSSRSPTIRKKQTTASADARRNGRPLPQCRGGTQLERQITSIISVSPASRNFDGQFAISSCDAIRRKFGQYANTSSAARLSGVAVSAWLFTVHNSIPRSISG